MAIQSDETLVTKGDLKTLYTDKILPYLGGNMMMSTNVGTYITPNEKIIGVQSNAAGTSWTPLYQKTFYFTMQSTAGDTVVDTIPTNAQPKNINGGVKQGDSSFIPFNYADTGNNYNFLYINNRDIHCVVHDNDLLSKTAFATIQYTKSNDTTNSALITPGCYDINRPDLQPENKEIFFGNGAYGYRATGTFNTTTDTRDNTLLLSLTRTSTTKFISQGGTIKRSVINPTSSDITIGGPFVSYNLANGITSTPFYTISIEADGIKLWRRDTTMSNIPYDIQFTYTK